MGIGSTLAVELGEADYREDCAQLIAKKAAQLVAARDMGRAEAIQVATEELRQEIEALGDVTGVQEAEIKHLSPSKTAPNNQVSAIASELLDAARDAADNL